MISRGHELPLITIAIPTYNRAGGYFPLALESALSQTYGSLEIIVADNCSSDHTPELVNGYRDPRVRYFRHTDPLKPNDNFNFCLQHARGHYLLLLHDDDLVGPDFVETCVAGASGRTDAGVIRTGTRVIDSKGVVIREARNAATGMSTADFFLAWFENLIEFYMCSTLYNTEKLRAMGGFRSGHNLFQDGIATTTLSARYGRVDVPDVKASFRVHGAELTGEAKVRNWCEDSLELLDTMCGLVPPEDRDTVRTRGMRFFAGVNYSRAARTAGVRRRAAAFLLVLRIFGYRHLPSLRLVIQGTRLHAGLRRFKRRVLGRPDWAADC